MTGAQRVHVLFVCLGNICRSPSAHGVFRAKVQRTDLARRIHIESAGTGDWHIGKAPDARAIAAAAARGIAMDDLRARQVTPRDLRIFDYVLAMDHDNLATLRQMAARAEGMDAAHVVLFSDYSSRYRGQAVPDPYFGGGQGFERVLDMIDDAADGLLAVIRKRLLTD